MAGRHPLLAVVAAVPAVTGAEPRTAVVNGFTRRAEAGANTEATVAVAAAAAVEVAGM